MRRLLAATALVVFLFIADVFSPGGVRSFVRESAASVQYGVMRSWSAITHLGIFETRATLARENADLTTQIENLSLQVASMQAMQAQDTELRQLLNLSQSTHGTAAPILSPIFASPYGTFTIGAGTSQGINTGDVVLMTADESAPDAFAIGTVAEAGTNTSLVTALFAPGRTTTVRLNGAEGELVGGGVNAAHMQVPHGITVAVGDIVASPAFADRPVGIVRSVIAAPSDAYSQIYVSLPVSPAARSFVYVTKP